MGHHEHVGFTGTRRGMTTIQKKNVVLILVEIRPLVAHHGMCVGADIDFHECVRSLYGPFCLIVGHPGVDSRGFAPSRGRCEVDEERAAWPYLERDRHIVNESGILIATPSTMNEQRRSGTWATIRMARGINLPRRIVYPDGTVDPEST